MHIRRLSLLLLLCLLSCLCVCSAAPDDGDNTSRGVLGTFKDWIDYEDTDADAAPEPSEDVATYDNDGIALMSVTTEDIDDGALTITMYGTYQYCNGTGTNVVATSSKVTASVINAVKSSSSFIYADTTEHAPDFADVIQITQTTSSTTPLFKKGAIFDFSLSNIQMYWDYKRIVSSGSKVVDCLSNGYGWGRIKVYDSLGNVHILDVDDCESLTFSISGKMMDIYGTTCALPCDVYKIEFVYYTDLIQTYGIPADAIDPDYSGYTSSGTEVTYIPHHHIGFINSVLILSEVEQTTGLLQSIVGGITSIKDAIINLPSTIANFIIDGLKSLFVPDDGFFDDYLDRWDVFLSEHFGFLYTSINTIVDIFKVLLNTEAGDGVVSFPAYTFNLAGADFMFGGWDVQLVPEGFGGVIDTLRIITDIILTIMFINFGVRKYDEVIKGGSHGDS